MSGHDGGLLPDDGQSDTLGRKRRPLAAAIALGDALKPPVPKAKPKRATSKRSPPSRPVRPAPGTFLSNTFECRHGAVHYRLYTPNGSALRRMPLVVMLHGCSQTATDFAVGTGMNRLADELGFLVLYPQQAQTANIGRCWNWHASQNQERGQGEPALIAALTKHAISLGRANPSRVYIAGISAGGAAAAIFGAAYPDLYVAVGVHSGVARGQIRSLGEALTAMQGKRTARLQGKLPRQLPTIVFHGDADRVVHPSNAAGFLHALERSRSGPLVSRTTSGRSERGREFTRKTYRSSTGELLLEDWSIHGSGHGWSGGSSMASHTDPAGPDASREMIRFFLTRKRKE